MATKTHITEATSQFHKNTETSQWCYSIADSEGNVLDDDDGFDSESEAQQAANQAKANLQKNKQLALANEKLTVSVFREQTEKQRPMIESKIQTAVNLIKKPTQGSAQFKKIVEDVLLIRANTALDRMKKVEAKAMTEAVDVRRA